MDIDKIFEMWKEDCQINTKDLESDIINTSKKHAKYLEMLSVSRLVSKRTEQKYKTLMKDKWLWYNGKMSKDEMDERGWSYTPLNGLKVLKSDLDKFYDSDPDVQELACKVEYAKTRVSVLEEIVTNLKWRHQTIKNILESRKLEIGM